MAMPQGRRILQVAPYQPVPEPQVEKFVAWFWMGPGWQTEYFWPDKPYVRNRPRHYDSEVEAQSVLKQPPPGCSIGGMGVRKVKVTESHVCKE